MDKNNTKSPLGMIVLLGAVWGLSEAALGMGLRSCAAMVSGAVMTGVALFFLAAGWVLSKRLSRVVIMVLIAAGFKMFDALLLGLPLRHGAIGNPIFAFCMEAAAFLIIIALIKNYLLQKPTGQALAGGLSALLAANLFPLVRFATGVPACVAPGTTTPLSLYYVHVAILISLVTVPLGFWLGIRLEAWEFHLLRMHSPQKINAVLSPAALIIALVIVAVIRLV